MDEIIKRLDELEAAVRELKWTLTQLLEKAPKIKFVPPTVEECNQFASEIGMTMDEATAFMLHYESNGWKVGKNPMKSWPATMKSWLSRLGDASSLVGCKGAAKPEVDWRLSV